RLEGKGWTLIGVAPLPSTQLFPANAINLDGSTQYLELQGSASRLDVGTDSLTLSFWANVKTSSTRERIRAYFKGETSSTGENEISIQILEDDSFFVGLNKTNLQGRYYYDTAIDGVEGWAHFLVVVSRSNDSDSGSLYVNGVLYTGSVTFDYQDSGWSSTNYTYTQPVYLGAQVRSTITYAQAGAFYGISIGQSFGQSDAEYLYNEGNPLCADYVETDNPTLYNKFDAWFDNATYNGSTELQALTDKVNGWVLDNVNNAPFDGKSALIVSDGSAQYNSAVVELDGSTQYLELQGSASRLNIGLNTIAVSSWTDGSSATTLYRKYESESTTSPNTSRAEIFIGGTSKDLIFQFITLGNQYNIKFQNINWTGEDKHILIYWDRLGNNLSNLHCYINGEEHTDKVFNSPLSGNPNSINWDMSLPVLWGKRNWAGYGQWENVAKFISISIGQAFTQSDAEYLYNNGNPLTADYVETDNPTLYNKFDAWFDNATYNGSTELQALTDKVNGWVLDNVNDAPFNSGLAVEC
ncbi:MAG: hypothetical protein HRU21_13540, partial [Pseudomonadales bacterium]|nr:hypothetical protein [Pseudomonadales bacterium]